MIAEQYLLGFFVNH